MVYLNPAEFFQQMVEQVFYPVYVISPANGFRFHYVNSATCNHYGYSKQELLQMSIPDWDPNFPMEKCEAIYQQLKKEKRLTFETVHKLKRGLCPVEVTSSYLRLDDQDYLVGHIQNIEMRKKAEGALRRTQEDLREEIKFRDQVMGVLSHDLRNPLNAICGFAEMLKMQEDLSPEAQRCISGISNAGGRMTELIGTVLDFVRSHEGRKFDLSWQRGDFHQVCDNVVEELRAGNPGRCILTRFSGDGSAEFDGGRIGQMVSNLVANALIYGSAERPIWVAVRSDPKSLFLTVQNYGEPIPKELMPHLFQPFHRGPENGSKKASKGLGLGLHIVQQIVVAHGGDIFVSSNAEAGTTFTVQLPKVREHAYAH